MAPERVWGWVVMVSSSKQGNNFISIEIGFFLIKNGNASASACLVTLDIANARQLQLYPTDRLTKRALESVCLLN